VDIFYHVSFFFKINGTKANTHGGIKMHCVMWHIHRWCGNRADGLQDVEVVVKILNKHLWLFSKEWPSGDLRGTG
jgi:hypothetical protein